MQHPRSLRGARAHRPPHGVVALALAAALTSCGDDGGADDTSTSSSTSTDATTSSSGDTSTSAAETSSSSSDGSTDSGSSETTAATTGGAEDPSYPKPDAPGQCPDQTAFVQLVGASVCAPFCEGPDGACPDPQSGDAVPTCIPFEQPGGSEQACTTHDECPGEEACDVSGMCVAVAFWGCQLRCEGGQTCSDGMICDGASACGYP